MTMEPASLEPLDHGPREEDYKPEEMWVQQNGRVLPIEVMEDDHLVNAIERMEHCVYMLKKVDLRKAFLEEVEGLRKAFLEEVEGSANPGSVDVDIDWTARRLRLGREEETEWLVGGHGTRLGRAYQNLIEEAEERGLR